MTDEEKKFTLDELPDEGSEPAPKNPPKKKIKDVPEPRVERLKSLTPQEKVDAMIQRWEFDEPIKSYFWIGFILILVTLEFIPLYDAYMDEIRSMARNSTTMSEIWMENAGIIEVFVKHPIIFLILLPFVYRSPHKSDYIFTVSFDGIDTVKKILPIGSKEIVSRVFIKWIDIHRVEKGFIDHKEILRLYSLDGHIGDLIWYIDLTKKKAIHVLLKGMIVPKHPLRIFLDNEKELK